VNPQHLDILGYCSPRLVVRLIIQQIQRNGDRA